tara:strand:+ start:404 stop:1213 length:810 start_codon:yes stop_codon:yes gene_type:complete
MNELKELAVKTDTELARLHGIKFDLICKIQMYRNTINSRWSDDSTKAEYANKIEAVKVAMTELDNEMAPLKAIYETHRWNRAFIVTNNGGHVHKSMDCNTCFPTTEFAWLVDYSSDSETTIVEAAGETACTVCYPSAPADVLNRPSTIVTADKIAKEAAKAERAAAKAEKVAKRPTVDGTQLFVSELWAIRQSKELKTERAAELWYAEAGENLTKEYRSNEWGVEGCAKIRNEMEKVAIVLSEKRNSSLETITAELQKKVQKRIKNNTY